MVSTRGRAAKVEDLSRIGTRSVGTLDPVVLLTVYLTVLFLIPSRLVVPAFGAAGRPTTLLGLVMAAAWLWTRTSPSLMIRGRQPLRIVLLVHLLVVVASLTVGVARGMPPEEARSAGRFLLSTISLAGVALMTGDLITSRHRLDVLLLRVVYGGAVVALIGALQFFLGLDVVSQIRVPGLMQNSSLLGIDARGDIGLRRVASTANHYIEFGVVMALILPLALHYAVHSPSRSQARARWTAVLLLAVGIPFSISRSATLTALVALGILVVAWSPPIRLRAALVLTLFLGIMRSSIPGLLGTIKSLFVNASNDPSVTARTDDYAVVFRYIAERPWLGRGAGTFMPERYLLLDNQYLGSLAATGLLGTAALLAIFLVGLHLAGRARALTHDAVTYHLTFALTAVIVGALVASFTFDSLAYAMFTSVLFICLGAAAALWRMPTADDSTPLTRSRPEILMRPPSPATP